MKPGNAGGGKAPWFKTDAGSDEEPEIGKPDNSTKRSEVAERVACQSEGRTRVSVLSSVRQGVSGRCAGIAYRSCKANKGAAGVDGHGFEDIEAYGEGRWLGELADRLRTKTYETNAVKRVWIPKPNSSKLRPLGVPTITERVVQTAVLLVLEPIFGADLAPQQYAYRPDRGAHDAIRAVHSLLSTGHTQVIDADRFVEGWRRLGCERRWSAHIVNYADDFVICCKRGAPEAMTAMRRIMERLKLTVNEEKTHLCEIPRERFDFLGYTFGRCYSRKDGHAYIGTRPSKKSVKRMVSSISEVTDRRTGLLDAEEIVGRLNRKLAGWANYFCLGPVSPTYQLIDTHVQQRLRRWLCKKHKDASTGHSRFPAQFLYEELGLVRLAPRTHNLPWANT
jgi:hypothetical protein